MPLFTKNAFATPFGRNEYLRSTQDVKTDSYTVAAASVPAITIDGFANQKVLQPGTVMAKITSGGDTGKIGPFQRGVVVNEVQTINLGAASAGTITITFDGETTAAIAFNANAAAVQAALEALSNVNAGDIVVTGGPLPGTVTLTFSGTQYAGTNVPQVTVTPTGLTGGTVTVATTTEGGAGAGSATDGRQTPANIVGICNTFLPWQLVEGDREIAVVYEASVVQAKCLEYTGASTVAALSNSTAAAMVAQKTIDIKFR